MKHFGVEARARRYDPHSRYGGHGGQSLAMGFPENGKSILGYHGVQCTVKRPSPGDGLVGVSKLELESPSLLDTERTLPWSKGPKQIRDRGRELFHVAEFLERQVEPQRVTKSRQCPGVVDTKYLLPAVGLLDTKQKTMVEHDPEAQWGQVELLISRVEGAPNLRRVPITCSWCRRGCKRCSKNKGRGGLCKSIDGSIKMKRLARRREAAQELPEALAMEDLHYKGLSLADYLDTLREPQEEKPHEGLSLSDYLPLEQDEPYQVSECSFLLVDDDVQSCQSWTMI